MDMLAGKIPLLLYWVEVQEKHWLLLKDSYIPKLPQNYLNLVDKREESRCTFGPNI
jgi:hypothetical protein